MAERLKQIWSGFEETTTRNLTGRGVDNIIVPNRVDYQAQDKAFLPEAFNAPAHAAFAALHEQIKAKAKRFGGRKKSKAKDADTEPVAMQSFVDDPMIKSLKSTALRVERTEMDYQGFLKEDGGKSLETLKKGKKRFILF